MRVLSLCDKTGNMVRPWLEAGHECVIVDIQHPKGIHRDGILTRVGADLLDLEPGDLGEFDFGASFTPCTHLAVSGARWWAAKGEAALWEGLALARKSVDILERIPTWMLENPVGRLSSLWRRPDHTFNPCDFGGYLTPPGDAYTKRTCLWTSPSFVMPEPRRVEPVEGSKMHLMAPSPARADLRSATPMGFAHAVFLANSRILSKAA